MRDWEGSQSGVSISEITCLEQLLCDKYLSSILTAGATAGCVGIAQGETASTMRNCVTNRKQKSTKCPLVNKKYAVEDATLCGKQLLQVMCCFLCTKP